MKKAIRLLCAFLGMVVVVIYMPSWASPTAHYDGEENEVSWEDLAGVLPSPYNKNPYLTVVTEEGTKQYAFNREMYLEKGFLVYGDPSAATDFGYNNHFKAVEGGYFKSVAGTSGIAGEYRYLGVTISGVLQTNPHFPSDDLLGGVGGVNLRVVKYSDMPEDYQKAYAVPAEGNAYFSMIQSLIDAEDSPAWDFTNNMEGVQVTLRSRFEEEGLSDISLFEYGLVYGWAAGGGSIRLFFQLKDDPSVYRYATFTGAISPEWLKSFSGLSCRLYSPQVGANGFYTLRPEEESFTATVRVEGGFLDEYDSLSETQRLFRYTRDDVEAYKTQFLQGSSQNAVSVSPRAQVVLFQGADQVMQYTRAELGPGTHLLTWSGGVEVWVEGHCYQVTTKFSFYLSVMPETTPAPTQTPSPSVTPAPTTAIRSPTPSPTESWYIRRRW